MDDLRSLSFVDQGAFDLLFQILSQSELLLDLLHIRPLLDLQLSYQRSSNSPFQSSRTPQLFLRAPCLLSSEQILQRYDHYDFNRMAI